MSERETLNNDPSSFPVERVDLPTRGQGWRRQPRLRFLATTLKSPKCIGLLGIMMIVAGIAMVAIGATLSNGFSSSSEDINRNQEGVPLSGLNGQLPAEFDCKRDLRDVQRYEEATTRAENRRFGTLVSNLAISNLQDLLSNLPEISVSLTFWVFHALDSTENNSLENDIPVQMLSLNKAFAGANIKFFLQGSGIHHIYVDNGNDVNCYDKKSTVEFINKINSLSSVAIIVCHLDEENGMAGILGDVSLPEEQMLFLQEDGQSHLGVIYISASALKDSHTSLIHQMGHLLGLSHPYPSYETCKVDGDLIADTEMIYRPSNSCVLQESSLCNPEREDVLQYSPGNLYMDISPDLCRDRFTPGQVLRMHAMVSEAMESGVRYFETATESKSVILPSKNIFSHAWQPRLPSSNILESHMKRYFSGLDDAVIKESFLDYSNPFTRLSEYAMLAVRDDIGSSSFSCLTKSYSGDSSALWIGSLRFDVDIQAIEINLEDSLTKSWSNQEPYLVMIKVGRSYETGYKNCTSSYVRLASLSQIIKCDNIVSGSSVKLVFAGGEIQHVCIRKLHILTNNMEEYPSLRPRTSFESVRNIANVRQTSTLGNLAAENALTTSTNDRIGTCSTTLLEKNAAWFLQLSTPVLIKSVSFDTTACPMKIRDLQANPELITSAARVLSECTTNTNGESPLKVTVSGENEANACEKVITSRQGGFHFVQCDEMLMGDVIKIQYVGDIEQTLAICSLQIRGSQVVSLVKMSILNRQEMYPNNRRNRNDYLLAMDNDETSCIQVNATESSTSYWRAHLKVPKNVLAIVIKGSGKNMTAILSDSKGTELWRSTSPAIGNIATKDDGVLSSIVTITGFEKLCEVLIGIDIHE